ncbi:hypothetical protein HUT19_26030 [Streptomyces sp. NA02950]|uniref:hypothetical protein n=1 Tax=Streptomyces sp. NA02950 TaxID=2742137 RepID=UPI001592464A|nr:hypothetical protein [Streptomyces sp. NA02950]QKV94782.1 hypothetical protein HUT19_26030 [Streptomyces sp. NA02950]
MADQARWLLIVEKAYRGSVETQFADALYCVPELHRQSGGCDLVLRGPAAGYALVSDFTPAVRIGGRTLDSLPDPGASVTRLTAAGVTVMVEEDGLTALGRTARDRLLPGVRVIDGGALASRWPTYEQVWFL